MTQKQYNETVLNHSDDLYRFALKSTGHYEDAKDVVQQSFEILWSKHEEVAFEKAKSFLFTVAYRKCIDEHRKQKKIKLKEEIPEHWGGSTEIIQVDLKRLVGQALDQLPDIQKQLILLKDYEGYSYDELAGITGLNESQVKVYLYRGRMSLKKSLVSVERNI